MADYRSTLTGTQMDAALLDMAEHNSEAYAVGERNGIAVASDDVTYHNNARYYAQIASSQIVGDASSAVRWDTDQSEVLTDAQKAQARENINAASDSDVVKITAQTLTSAQQSQARANIMAGGSNRNLLDNPFFTVNQRNFTTSTGVNNFYSVDRWYIARGTGTISKTSNGITINGVGASRETTFQQMIDCGDLTGRTVTLSVNDGGTIRQITGVVPARTASNNIFIRFTLRDGVSAFLYAMSTSSAYAYMLQVQVNAGYTIDIRAVKLELGSVSTLANDTPPDYGEELAKCQRYFVRLNAVGYNYIPVASGVWSSVSTVRMLINTPVPMRAVPTISRSGSFKCAGNGTTLDVSALGALAITDQGVFANVLTNGSPVLWQYYALLMLENSYIDLSADL